MKTWGLRILVFAGIAALCWAGHSVAPALAFALAWIPNGIFLGGLVIGAIHLPRVLEPVHRAEPVLYRWLGVGLVKWIVTTHAWLLLVGLDAPPKPSTRNELLDRAELVTKGAELCHGATFMLAAAVALVLLATGHHTAAIWITVFNVALNGYPVMLQRSNRWRIRRTRRGAPGRNSLQSDV